MFDVPVLDPEVAAGFLIDRTGDPDERAAAELAVELGGLPLALEQGAAYIQATGTTLAGYLSLFQDRRGTCWPAVRQQGIGGQWLPRCGWHCPGWGKRLRSRREWSGYWRAWHRSRCR